MHIVLVIPPGKSFLSTNWMASPPMGMSYCAAVLEKDRHKVTIVDAFAEGLEYDGLAQKVARLHPDAVGIYFMTDNRFRGFRAIREIKKALPQIKIMAGGPHPTLAADDTLRNIPQLDYIVRGEGEAVVPKLVKYIEKGALPEGLEGVSYRKNSQVYHNPDGELIKDLDSIPFPATHLLSLDKYNYHVVVPGKGRVKALFVLNSRGCPFKCIFCSNTLLWGNKYRSRSPENFVDEIEFDINTYGVRGFTFSDDTFNNNRENVFRICDLILQRGLALDWTCQVRVDQMDRQMAMKMKEAGCFALQFGVESGKQRIIDEVINKHITLQQVENVLAYCREAGLWSFPNFMFGFPTETYEDTLVTLNYIKKIHREGVFPVLNLIKIYPGTRIEEIARKEGVIPRDFSWADEHFTVRVKDALPSVLGFAPLYRDKLSWVQIGEILFQWGDSRKDIIHVWQIAFNALKGIRRIRDITRLFCLSIAFIKVKAGEMAHAGRGKGIEPV